MAMSVAAQRVWMEQWRRAAVALEAQRRQELRAMSDDAALAASDALLALAPVVRVNPDRLADSGLVRQQAFFRRHRR